MLLDFRLCFLEADTGAPASCTGFARNVSVSSSWLLLLPSGAGVPLPVISLVRLEGCWSLFALAEFACGAEDGLQHGVQAVGSGGGKVLLQADGVDEVGLGGEDLRCAGT